MATQQQRREETVARLLEASIATIIEVGYARASAAVITKRQQGINLQFYLQRRI
jgi:AcrR family transcriptional regulator